MKHKLHSFSLLWILYALLAFPSFYFVYKFGNPLYGTNDFFSYYQLYQNWDIQAVEAPFNMRLLSSFFVFIFNKIGFYYETAAAFDQFKLSKQVFFNAVLLNYVWIITTCVVICQTVQKYLHQPLISFFSGLLYLLGFGTLFYEMMPITDALSVLLFAIIFRLYLAQSYLIIGPLVLLILQREYVFLALGLITVLDFLKLKSNYYLHVLVACVLCFLTYYTLRKTLFFTPRFDYQASPTYFIENVFTLKFPLWPYIKQVCMTLNITLIYLLIIGYKKMKKMSIDTYNFLKITLLFLQINVISFVAAFGNNTGRYFYILIPLVIFQLVKEVQPLIPEEK